MNRIAPRKKAPLKLNNLRKNLNPLFGTAQVAHLKIPWGHQVAIFVELLNLLWM
jgi:hypothetical protein